MPHITRTYVHKTHGEIGKVEFDVPDAAFKLDGKELPAASVMHLMTFALQSLQDSYAGAEDSEDARAKFDTKLRRLLEGTVGVKGEALPPLEKMCLTIAREELRKLMKANGKPYKEFTERTPADQTDILTNIVNQNRATIEPEAKKRIKALEAKAKEESKINVDVSELLK